MAARRAKRRATVAVSVFVVLLGGLMAKIVLDPESTGVVVTWDPSSVADPSDVHTAPDGGQYAFLSTQPDSDEPVTYDPCEPIDVVVNTRTGPGDALAVVDSALREVSELSGLTFRLEGETSQVPTTDWEPERDGDAWQPVLVAWTDPDEVDELAGGVAGLGGSAWLEEDGQRRYITGQVLLDGPQLAALGEEQTRATVLHELAHLVGLDHVDDRGELMYPTGGRFEWGPGDLAGLQELGQGGCG